MMIRLGKVDRRGAILLALATAAGWVVSACGSGGPDAADGTAVPGSPTVNDPALKAAAQVVEPELRKSFAGSFAGLVLDHGNHVMTVYRRPDAALDARVRALVPQVKVVFRDARYSLAQMQQVVDQLLADESYWRSQGIMINGAGPEPDGSGVVVFTPKGWAREQQELSQHYPAIAITVRKRTIVPPTGSPLPPIKVSEVPTQKTIAPHS